MITFLQNQLHCVNMPFLGIYQISGSMIQNEGFVI